LASSGQPTNIFANAGTSGGYSTPNLFQQNMQQSQVVGTNIFASGSSYYQQQQPGSLTGMLTRPMTYEEMLGANAMASRKTIFSSTPYYEQHQHNNSISSNFNSRLMVASSSYP